MRTFNHRSLFIVAALAGLLVLSTGAQAQDKTLARELDPVVVKGDPLKAFWDKPHAGMRLYAYRNGDWSPIPYQIDKVNPDGDYFIEANTLTQEIIDETGFKETSEAKKREDRIDDFEDDLDDFKEDVAKGKMTQADLEKKRMNAYNVEKMDQLDYNDDLVFMGRDAGGRAPRERWLSPQGIELNLEDPLNQKKAWVYLFYFDKEPPAPSKTDYIKYDPLGDTIITRLSEIDFVDGKPMIVESIIGKPPGQPIIPNVLDRFKLRIKIKPIGLACIPLNFDENNAKAFTIGYKDGPVRLIRRNIFWIIIAGVRLPFAPKIVMYFKFYENGLTASSDLYVPINPKWFVCSGSKFTAGLDFRRNTFGSKIFTQDNKGIVIDGKMSPEETNLVRPNQDWIAGYLPSKAALMSRMIYDPKMIENGAKLDLYFMDDDARVDPPENEAGEHLVGYTMDVKAFPKGKYYVGFQIYTAYNFEESQIQELLDIDDHPIRVTATGAEK